MKEQDIKQIREYLAARQDEIIGNLKKLVAIPSVGCQDGSGYPYGAPCAAALDFVLALAAEKGLETENSGYYYGLASWGSGSRHIGIFSHVDVVEAGEGWLYPPFACTEREGWLIGRGVGDDKHAAILGIYVLAAVRDLHLADNCRLTLFFGCNEEAGMDDLNRYLAQQPQPDVCLVPDIRFPVCIGEKGNLTFTLERENTDSRLFKLHGGIAGNIVPAYAEAELRLTSQEQIHALAAAAETQETVSVKAESGGRVTVTARGKQSSSSMAQLGVNAVGVLCRFLTESGLFAGVPLLEECARLTSQWDGGVFGIRGGDEFLGQLTVPCVFFDCGGEGCRLQFNLRYPASLNTEEILGKISSCAENKGWTMRVISKSLPYCLPAEHGLVSSLLASWSSVTGKSGEPFAIGGGTYARKLKNAVGFGPHDGSLCPFLPEGHGAIHGPDEARSISNIMESILIYAAALCDLLESGCL